ncbi:dinitrogenase iron-molybdenum cofactor biosynthesis protein [Lachnospiraceae bacterium ZAX-1]
MKSWRVAVASTDGKVINEHFGKAKEFLIVDIKADGTYELVERRTTPPACNGGEHSEHGMEDSVRSLSDCAAVLVAKIGGGAERALAAQNIVAFEHPALIDDALVKLSKYFVKTSYSKPISTKEA